MCRKTELEIIVLSNISQAQKTNISCSHSFVEPGPKIMMMIIYKVSYMELKTKGTGPLSDMAN
jgi:hypothetical protein